MTPFIIVGYYTVETEYEDAAQVMRKSLEKFEIDYDLTPIENKGSWYKNTNYKPTFLREQLKKHAGKNIVYVDCDAEFLRYPILFEKFEGEVGVYLFCRSFYNQSGHPLEVLSGTIFLKNCEAVSILLEKWERECRSHMGTWDQKSLEKVLAGNYTKLPAQYCTIIDTMRHIQNPVIVHFQASRNVRKGLSKVSLH